MEMQIRDYQQKCIDSAKEKLNNGAKHISISMLVGTGKTFLLYSIIQQLHISNPLIICKYKLSKDMITHTQCFKDLASQHIQVDVYTQTFAINTRTINFDNYPIVFFLDCDSIFIKNIEEDLLNNFQGKTISIFNLRQDIADDYSENTFSIVQNNIVENYDGICVFETKNVIDIREINFDKIDEVPSYNAQVIAYTKDFVAANEAIDEKIIANERIIQQNEYEINSLLKPTFLSLETYSNKIETSADEIADAENAYLKNQLESKDKQIQELLKENLKLKRDKEINKQTIQFAKQLLIYAGISEKHLNKSIKSMKDIISTLYDDYESNKLSQDEYEKKVQDTVAKSYRDLSAELIQPKDRKDYEILLEDCLGKIPWSRLDPKSKDFLISAKHIMYSFQKSDNPNDWDYSGVCLLVTKALEIEAVNRFYLLYKKYLLQTNNPDSNWPTKLKSNYDDITLGNIAFLAGYSTRLKQSPVIGDKRLHALFTSFASKKLYNHADNIENEIFNDIVFIEKVRQDYRNPAAHKKSMDRITAEDCFDYVIEIEQKLRKMLENMQI